MTQISTFDDVTRERLKFYVDKLIDPRNGMTFYVGKGKGNRVFEHVNAAIEIGDDEDDLSLKFAPDDRLVLIKVRPETVSDRGLYEAVRRSWVVKRERVETADYVLAIVRGVCRGVFQAYEWRQSPGRDKRWEFEGREVQGDVAARYVEKLIPPDKRKPGMAAPVLYVGC